MAVPKKRKSLGRSLVEQKLITEDQLKKAEQESETTGEHLRKSLVKLGMVSEDDICNFFEEQLGIPRVELGNYLIEPMMLALIPENLARKFLIIPLFKTGDTITVATADPLNVVALDEIRLKTGSNIETTVTTETDVRNSINQYYGTGGSIEDIIKGIDEKELRIGEGKEEEIELERLKGMAEEAPIIKLVNLILMQAVRDKASDIHIEPEDAMVRVRLRVDGILRETSQIPKNLQAAVISRVKIMSDLNIATKRTPQDGRFRINIENSQIDLRVSTFPTVHGENVVMRLLDTSSVLIGLEQLGFNEHNLEEFRKLILKPNGIILITGPTGSGKTTTLYSALSVINSVDKNIITVEEPVEYQLPMIRQSQVNVKAGLTFATGLRAILRQDPDIVMVGEIRDLETAEIAIQAALTGHLVFSTLHTNDAPGALTRLIDMGIEPFLISSSVIAVLAQRLVRVICSSCKESYTPSSDSLKRLGIELPKEVKLYRGKGCSACKNRGYKGRIGIFEMMLLDNKIKDMILKRASSAQIAQVAREAGMKSLREDGMEKVLAGSTTIEEVIRVTQAE